MALDEPKDDDQRFPLEEGIELLVAPQDNVYLMADQGLRVDYLQGFGFRVAPAGRVSCC